MSERSLTCVTVLSVQEHTNIDECKQGHRKRAPSMSAEERRASILDAVSAYVVSAQMDVSTKEIARLAGVAEGTLFRVFDDKQDLLDAAFHHELERLVDDTQWQERTARFTPSMNVEDRVRMCILLMSDVVEDWSNIIAAMRQTLGRQHRQPPTGAPHGPGPGMKGLYARILHKISAELERQLEPVADQLTMPVSKAASVIYMMLTAQSLAYLHHFETGLSIEDYTQAVLYGIAKPQHAQR